MIPATTLLNEANSLDPDQQWRIQRGLGWFRSKIVSEYKQEILQATSSLFPIKMIAILERTQSNVQQNIEQLHYIQWE